MAGKRNVKRIQPTLTRQAPPEVVEAVPVKAGPLPLLAAHNHESGDESESEHAQSREHDEPHGLDGTPNDRFQASKTLPSLPDADAPSIRIK